VPGGEQVLGIPTGLHALGAYYSTWRNSLMSDIMHVWVEYPNTLLPPSQEIPVTYPTKCGRRVRGEEGVGYNHQLFSANCTACLLIVLEEASHVPHL